MTRTVRTYVYFNKLSDDNLKKIVKLEMNKMSDRVRSIGYDINYDDSSVEHILNLIKSESEFGARPIIRAIENEYENKITDLIITNEYQEGHTFNITCLSENGVSVV